MCKRIIGIISNFFAFVAVIYSVSPCYGKYYEPKMPDELITK